VDRVAAGSAGQLRQTAPPGWLRDGGGLILVVAATDLALHLALSGRYGYWIDELYFIACGDHLDWGYVDQPPLIAVVAHVSRLLLGDSLFALRFFPAVAAAALVVLTGSMTRALGGGRNAQVIAAVAVCVVPVYALFGNVLTMNSFEPLLWMGAAYLAIRTAKGQSPRLWLGVGVIVGVGLLNKYSMAFFAGALAAGILVSPQRHLLLNRWFWLAALVAALIALPNLVWEFELGWPTVELLANAKRYQHQPVTPLEFVWGQIQIVHPLLLPLWAAGLGFLLAGKRGARFRFLGWTFVIQFAAFLRAKTYYLAPIYPMLFAAGAVAAEPRRAGVAGGLIAVFVIGFAPLAPYVLPVLPVEALPAYLEKLRMKEVRAETRKMGNVPQVFADMLGWDELVAEIARVYASLAPEERRLAVIWGNSYDTAGAVDYLGRAYGLPKAISGHQNYYLWKPRELPAGPMIAVGFPKDTLSPWFDHVEPAGEVRCEFCMPDRRVTHIYVCRGLKVPMDEFWPLTKCWTCDRPAFATAQPNR
jgi:hypothetical protein